MPKKLEVVCDAWAYGDPIPDEFAFCVPAEEGHITIGPNLSPPLRWSDAPSGTKSFVLICHDSDVPSKPDDVNKEGALVPASLPRVDFYHWVLIDIPATVHELAKGADSSGVTPGGKPAAGAPCGRRGINNYTDWFASDAEMKGDYHGYDGPCPPWNDEIVHHYHFTVYALDVPSLKLDGRFGGPQVLAAIERRVLAKGCWVGEYALNPKLRER